MSKTSISKLRHRPMLGLAALLLAASLCVSPSAKAGSNSSLVNPMPGHHTAQESDSDRGRTTSGAGSGANAGERSASAPTQTASAPLISIRSEVAKQLREAIEKNNENPSKGPKPTVVVKPGKGEEPEAPAVAEHRPKPAPVAARRRPAPVAAKEHGSAAALAAVAGHGAAEPNADAHAHATAHWDYEGDNGPPAWGRLQPAYQTCASGRRQSPIHIDEASNLRGPAEALKINYMPSHGSVVNNGHTVQVDLDGNNTLTVRGSTYKLVQFHFHHPAEEKINYKGFAMVAHLVHKNAEGNLAVLAVLFDPGETNPVIENIWTHMPLDVNDRVPLPDGLVDLNEILPKDRRYYQFMGSLTTPPCTEGVLWLVLKTPMTMSRDQLKLITQLFPNNARPTQPTNGRIVREAQ